MYMNAAFWPIPNGIGAIALIPFDTIDLTYGANLFDGLNELTLPTFIPRRSGYYQITGHFVCLSAAIGNAISIYLSRNGAVGPGLSYSEAVAFAVGQGITIDVNKVIYATVGDIIGFWAYYINGAAPRINGAVDNCFMTVHRLS